MSDSPKQKRNRKGQFLEGKKARKAGRRRCSSPKKIREKEPSIFSTSNLLLGLACLASAASPIAAASLHSPKLTTPHRTRRERREAGERKRKVRFSPAIDIIPQFLQSPTMTWTNDLQTPENINNKENMASTTDVDDANKKYVIPHPHETSSDYNLRVQVGRPGRFNKLLLSFLKD